MKNGMSHTHVKGWTSRVENMHVCTHTHTRAHTIELTDTHKGRVP